MIVSKISFGSPFAVVVPSFMHGNDPNGWKKEIGNLHTALILFKHLSFLFYALAVCVILLSGCQISENINEERNMFSTKHRIQKKFGSLLQHAKTCYLQGATGITKCDRTGVRMKNFPA